MNITIHPTIPEEADVLAGIQQAAFKPLYEACHDEDNPYLRGTEDILCRFNEKNRYFTILCDGEIVGGILYRVSGKRSPWDVLAEGEYYLARVYVKPELQGQHIARTAIRLCEKEFPDAVAYYVDFPEDLEKNRRCYESVGYRDTGKRIRMDGSPALAMFEKFVTKEEYAMNYQDINARTTNLWCENGWEWGQAISHEEYQAAVDGKWDVKLTPTKYVPHDWFGSLKGKRCLVLLREAVSRSRSSRLAAQFARCWITPPPNAIVNAWSPTVRATP